MKILFLIALGLNPRQLKKDCNVKQEKGLKKMPKRFASKKTIKKIKNPVT